MKHTSSLTQDLSPAPGVSHVETTVLLSQQGAVAIVTLNRPDRLNALTEEMESRYVGLLQELDHDPSVRAVVVTGAGRGFCAGADTSSIKDIGSPDFTVDIETRKRTFATRMDKPLIAAVNGPAAGMGLMQAVFCDLRFAAPEAKFTTAFVRRGLAGEYGSTWLLPRLVGPAVAADLLLSARVVSAQEALAIGLVNAIAPEGTSVLDYAVAYATDLAENCSPHAIALTKAMLRNQQNTSFDDAVEESVEVMHGIWSHPDAQEGVTSFLERRAPHFAPLSSTHE